MSRSERFGIFRDLVLYERPAARGGSFFLDRLETTHADWLRWLRATGSAPSPQLAALWGASEPRGASAEQPVVRVTLLEARAFARWRFCRLVRLDEWSFAASRGGQSRFPWGDADDACRANSGELGLARPGPVGAFEAGRDTGGAYDLLGNVAEWSETPAPETLEVALARVPLRVPALAPWSMWPIVRQFELVAAQPDARFLVLGGHFLTASIDGAGAPPEPLARPRVPREWGDTTGVRLAVAPGELLRALLQEPVEPERSEQALLEALLRVPTHRAALAKELAAAEHACHAAGPLRDLLRRELRP